jgi:hypothetical protein
MKPQRQEYKGHRIELRAREDDELRAREAERGAELELLIDDQPVRYGQLPDGSYALHEYAYDWSDNLIDLTRRFIDYRDRADKIRRRDRRCRGLRRRAGRDPGAREWGGCGPRSDRDRHGLALQAIRAGAIAGGPRGLRACRGDGSGRAARSLARSPAGAAVGVPRH